MKMRAHYWTTSALLLLLGGCSLAPEYNRPALPVADTLAISQDGQGAKEGSTQLAQIGWRQYFLDANLQHLIEVALKNNRDLRVSALNVESYQAQYKIQRAALMPTIAADGYGQKVRTLSGETHVTSESYSASVGITSWEIDFFGRIRSLKDQALEQYLGMEETLRSSQIALVAEVAKAYLTWMADRELLAITEDTLRIEKESYELIQQRAEEGVANQMELAQSRTSYESAKANLALYRRQVAQDANALSLLTGSTLPASILQAVQPMDGQLERQMIVAQLPAQLPSDTLLQRPDIMAAEHNLKGANANIGAARAAFFPSISLTASAGVINTDLADLFESGSGSWLFKPALNLPLFTGGSLSAQLEAAKVNQKIAVANYELAIQTAFQEAADALVASGTYNEQLQAQAANLQANQEYFSLARDRYKEGVDSFLTLLDAQRSLYTARQNYLTLQLAQQTNLVELYKVLGGGWKE